MNNPQQPYQPYPQNNFQQPPPKPKSNKWLWIILGLVIGVPTVLMGGCVACIALIGSTAKDQPSVATSNTTSSGTTKSTQTNAAPARTKVNGLEVYKTGESVGIGSLGYQVYDSWYTSKLSGNQFIDQPPDAKYLFVDLGIVNTAKEAYTIPPFKLIDENNAEYETSSKGFMAEGSIGLLDKLNPSVSKRAYVIFDVPQGRNYKLKVSGGYWSGESALIELSPKAKK